MCTILLLRLILNDSNKLSDSFRLQFTSNAADTCLNLLSLYFDRWRWSGSKVCASNTFFGVGYLYLLVFYAKRFVYILRLHFIRFVSISRLSLFLAATKGEGFCFVVLICGLLVLCFCNVYGYGYVFLMCVWFSFICFSLNFHNFHSNDESFFISLFNCLFNVWLSKQSR